MIGAHSLEDAKHAHGIDIGGELRRVERHLHMALSGEIIYFVGHHLAHKLHQRHRVAHIGIVQVEIWQSLQVCDALAIIHRRTAYYAMHIITLSQKKFGKK